MVMKPEELQKLKMKSQYDDGANEWTVPVFLLKAREVALPSLSIKKQATEFMENQKNERQLIFDEDDDQDRNEGSSGGSTRNNFMAHYEAA
jgi:hypothetical protein